MKIFTLNHYIYKENDLVDSFYIVSSGEVCLEKAIVDGI